MQCWKANHLSVKISRNCCFYSHQMLQDQRSSCHQFFYLLPGRWEFHQCTVLRTTLFGFESNSWLRILWLCRRTQTPQAEVWFRFEPLGSCTKVYCTDRHRCIRRALEDPHSWSLRSADRRYCTSSEARSEHTGSSPRYSWKYSFNVNFNVLSQRALVRLTCHYMNRLSFVKCADQFESSSVEECSSWCT